MKLPNFIICGTQKGGTSALYYFLKEHPEIYLSPKKEVHYFDLNYQKGLKWYEKHFKGASSKYKAIGEASPLYMYLEEVPERIHKTLPDAKLIFITESPTMMPPAQNPTSLEFPTTALTASHTFFWLYESVVNRNVRTGGPEDFRASLAACWPARCESA